MLLTELSAAQENAIYDRKCRNVLRERDIRAAHDEPKDSLAQKTSDHGHLGPEVVDNESAADRAWHVEEIDDDGETQDDAESIVASRDAVDDC